MIAHRALSLVLLAPMLVPGQSPGAPPEQTIWRNAQELRVEGKGWADTKGPFDRFPARAEATVRPAVWDLSRNSAGLLVGFVTDASTISARWTLTSGRIAMNHMPATGVSGVDLYVLRDGRWHFLAVGRPAEKERVNEFRLVQGLEPKEATYRLYLPLYNGVERVEIGVPAGSSIRAPVEFDSVPKPIVIYGTSITQGGCASRPGMAYPSILGRRLGLPVINLGFSGNGKGEPQVAQLLAELDPAAFVLDCLPNMTPDEVRDRLPVFLDILRSRHPQTQILLVENIPYTDMAFVATHAQKVRESNEHLARIHRERAASGDRRIVLVPAGALIGTDGEATVDGVHPTDLGFVRIADAIEPYLREALSINPGSQPTPEASR